MFLPNSEFLHEYCIFPGFNQYQWLTSSPVGLPLSRLRVSGRARAGGLKIVASETKQQEPDLSFNVNGLHMPNPYVIGSGPPGTNYNVMKKAFVEGWGAVIAKIVSLLIHNV